MSAARDVDDNDLRRALLLQVRLFGSQTELAAALGLPKQTLSGFLCRRSAGRIHNCPVRRALGVEVVTEVVYVQRLELKEKL